MPASDGDAPRPPDASSDESCSSPGASSAGSAEAPPADAAGEAAGAGAEAQPPAARRRRRRWVLRGIGAGLLLALLAGWIVLSRLAARLRPGAEAAASEALDAPVRIRGLRLAPLAGGVGMERVRVERGDAQGLSGTATADDAPDAQGAAEAGRAAPLLLEAEGVEGALRLRPLLRGRLQIGRLGARSVTAFSRLEDGVSTLRPLWERGARMAEDGALRAAEEGGRLAVRLERLGAQTVRLRAEADAAAPAIDLTVTGATWSVPAGRGGWDEVRLAPAAENAAGAEPRPSASGEAPLVVGRGTAWAAEEDGLFLLARTEADDLTLRLTREAGGGAPLQLLQRLDAHLDGILLPPGALEGTAMPLLPVETARVLSVEALLPAAGAEAGWVLRGGPAELLSREHRLDLARIEILREGKAEPVLAAGPLALHFAPPAAGERFRLGRIALGPVRARLLASPTARGLTALARDASPLLGSLGAEAGGGPAPAVGTLEAGPVRLGVVPAGGKAAAFVMQAGRIRLDPAGGRLDLEEVAVTNPPGYGGPPPLRMGAIRVRFSPGEIFAAPMVIDELRIEAMRLHFDPKPAPGNLGTIRNLLAGTPSPAPGRGVRVRRFVLTEAVARAGPIEMTFRNIEEEDLRADSPGGLAQAVGARLAPSMAEFFTQAAARFGGALLGPVGKAVGTGVGKTVEGVEKTVEGVGKGVGGLLRSLLPGGRKKKK